MGGKINVADQRVKLINEVLNGIKSVKMYAWEECLMEEIKHLRSEEVKALRKADNVESLTLSSWSFGPMVCVLSILAYQWIFDPERISADSMIVLLPIVDLLIGPMGFLTDFYQSILMVSIDEQEKRSPQLGEAF